MSRYWRRAEVERRAWQAVQALEQRGGVALAAPVDVDLVGEIVFGLWWDWALIPEPPGRRIWAGLVPEERRVILNERHLPLYQAIVGLERFTKAHEVGHWVCHVLDGPSAVCDQPSAIAGPASALTADGRRLTALQERWRERHADWFAAALLMPAPLVIAAARGLDLDRWGDRYRLRDRFNVSISALNRRLSDLGLAPAVGGAGLDVGDRSPVAG